MIRTQGDVRVLIHDIPVHFQVVDNDFPDSLQFGEGDTLFRASSSHDLPPRTKVLITVPTNSTDASGYVRSIDAGPGIFVGEAPQLSWKNLMLSLPLLDHVGREIMMWIHLETVLRGLLN